MENFDKKIALLYKKLVKDEKVSEKSCRNYLKSFNKLKDDLVSKGRIKYWDFDDISLGKVFKVSDDDVKKARNDMIFQLKDIAVSLQITLEEEAKEI